MPEIRDSIVRPPRWDADLPPLAEPSTWHEIGLEINGQPVRAMVESRLLLVDFLRHRLRLTGTHVGCEQGSCGACTVIIDGHASRSCLAFAVQVDGASIRTVEDLAPGDAPLTDLQRAFHEEHGMQCGFCTPGFLMSLASLEGEDDLDETAVTEQLDGNLCRCTGYLNIKKAACRALLGGAEDAAPPCSSDRSAEENNTQDGSR
ncbi:(2Fe-2S)-binding protein [Demetria terragena]|uniref:(2Fe-2S)-binding protein n=1 Tax=Demetria terragena TaxID=63959 RepID=UPI00036059F5|nr:(2Fe-2S)-binding protein [Demetria terragena]